MKRILLLVILFGFFSSCDPIRVLIISANSNKNTSICIYGNNNVLPTWERGNTDPQQVVLKVPVQDSVLHEQRAYYYGIGVWDDLYLKGFLKNIDSIIIISSKGTLHLRGAPEMEKYLKKHRHGLFKHVLELRVH